MFTEHKVEIVDYLGRLRQQFVNDLILRLAALTWNGVENERHIHADDREHGLLIVLVAVLVSSDCV